MSSSSRKRRLVSPQQPDEEQAEPRAARRTDRIVVDVGGTRFTTSASTLTSASEYFERLLSPRWCAEPPDEIFLDRDPEPFAILLTYMRTGLLELSKDNQSLARRVMVEAQFLGMQSCIDCVKVAAVKSHYSVGLIDGDAVDYFDQTHGSFDAAIRDGILPARFFAPPPPPPPPKIVQVVPAPPGTRVRICYEELEEDEDPDDEELLLERWVRKDPVVLDAICLVHYDIPKRIPTPADADEEWSWPDAPSRLDAYVQNPRNSCTALASEVYNDPARKVRRTKWYEVVAAADEKVIEIPEGTLTARYWNNREDHSEGHFSLPVRHLRVSTNGYGATGYVPVDLNPELAWPSNGLSLTRHNIVRWQEMSRDKYFKDFE